MNFQMGDPSVEVTEESREASQLAKAKAMEAISEGNLEEAIVSLTEAISLNPTSAIMYGNRGMTLTLPDCLYFHYFAFYNI